MADSKYPSQLDSDIVLPRVDDNLSEIGGEAINGLRSAVFNIEETLGINPQGSVADVVTRLNESLNADGTIKASALSSVGLVTLPITNSQVGPTAGIEESKLDLDHSTVSLRTLIDQLRTDLTALQSIVTTDVNNLNKSCCSPCNIWSPSNS